MNTITKEFTFDAAHRLIKGYQGKCKNNHGHTYRVKIEISCPVLDKFDFVVDFGDIKKVKQWVDDNWDHATLLNADDTDFIQWLKDNQQRLYTFAGNPTAENMAEKLMTLARNLLFADSSLPPRIRPSVTAVEVWETPTSSARVEAKGDWE